MTTLAFKIYTIMSDGEARTIKQLRDETGGRYRIVANMMNRAANLGRFERVGRSGKATTFRIMPYGMELYEQRKAEYANASMPIYVTPKQWPTLQSIWR